MTAVVRSFKLSAIHDLSDTSIEVAGASGQLVMDLVHELGFNERDIATWNSLDMDAVTASHDGRLVGAIPYERRKLQIAPDVTLGTAHESVVGLRPRYRGRRLGSRMQEAFAARPPHGVEALTVFREKPGSGAYRWYRANGFEPVMRVHSRLLDDPSVVSASATLEIHPVGPGTEVPWSIVDERRRAAFGTRSGGHIHRPTRGLQNWLDNHPYRRSYRFEIITLGDIATPEALAVCGIGRMHSEGERLEILELISPGWELEPAAALVAGICRHAASAGHAPVRWAIAESDPFNTIADELGITRRWWFEMLLRPVDSSVSAARLRELAAATPWRYQALDYI